MGLYEQIADEYDQITGESARAAAAEAFLRELCRRYGVASALDVACGTGLHAVLLARMSVRVTASDISAAMLARARRRAAEAGVGVQWAQAPMQAIDRHAPGPFDAVLCLGNSLPHLLTPADLDAAAGAFAAVLTPGGVAAIGVLNYARILARGERIVGVTRAGGAEHVRFYDFLGERVQFNVLTLRWSADGTCRTELTGTPLRPYVRAEIEAALAAHGFGRIEAFGGMQFAPFDERQSDSLLLVARRG